MPGFVFNFGYCSLVASELFCGLRSVNSPSKSEAPILETLIDMLKFAIVMMIDFSEILYIHGNKLKHGCIHFCRV